MITFKTNVRPSGFDRPVTKYFQDQVLSRLVRAGIDTLTVIIERDSRRKLILRFEGPEDEVTKANAIFGGLPSAQAMEKPLCYSDGEGSAVL